MRSALGKGVTEHVYCRAVGDADTTAKTAYYTGVSSGHLLCIRVAVTCAKHLAETDAEPGPSPNTVGVCDYWYTREGTDERLQVDAKESQLLGYRVVCTNWDVLQRRIRCLVRCRSSRSGTSRSELAARTGTLGRAGMVLAFRFGEVRLAAWIWGWAYADSGCRLSAELKEVVVVHGGSTSPCRLSLTPNEATGHTSHGSFCRQSHDVESPSDTPQGIDLSTPGRRETGPQRSPSAQVEASRRWEFAEHPAMRFVDGLAIRPSGGVHSVSGGQYGR